MKTKMMIIVSAVIISIVAGVLGFNLGCMYSVYSSGQDILTMNKRTKELTRRTEAYEPSCEELKNTGVPQIVKNDFDYYFVHVENDYFHVFGLNFLPGKPPVMTWWGGGRHAALGNCRNK